MVYYSVTIQSSQNRMSNFNTDIEEYLSTKKKKTSSNWFLFYFAKHTATANQSILKKKKSLNIFF